MRTPFTYGLLYQQEEDLADRCREAVDDALAALQKSVRKAPMRAGELATAPNMHHIASCEAPTSPEVLPTVCSETTNPRKMLSSSPK